MENTPSLTMKSKHWIDLNGEVVFGIGRIQLFEAIEKTGSMNQAAALLGMSYRAAWGKVATTEDRLKIKLVERHKGNRRSGTTLTPEGKELLHLYSSFQQEVQKSADELFEKYFGDMLQHLTDQHSNDQENK
jgi:molybdate transport system regulatory protein